ncbi:MAG: hypothetical protein IIW52_03910 [Alistipes sp.]|nr:hypothetical protein [Alistipes sp.]
MKKLIFMVVTLLMVTACNTENMNSGSWSKSIDGDMVTTNTVSGVEYVDNATIVVEMTDITKPYVNIAIEGVKFVPMMPDVNFLVSNIAFKLYPSDDVNDPLYGSWTFNEAAVVPTVGGVSREEYTMLNFKGSINDYGVVLEFDVNFGGAIYHAVFGQNDALQSWEATYKATATTILNPGEQSVTFDDEFTVSFLQENLSKQVVTVIFKDIRFSPAMPEVTFTMNNVPFAYDEDGTERLFNVATVVPQVNGAAYEQFTMTAFKGSVSNQILVLDLDITSMNSHITITGSTK